MQHVTRRSHVPALHLLRRQWNCKQQQLRTLHHQNTETKKTPVRYLIIDGYIKWGRDDLVAGGATTAGQLYADMFVNCTSKHCDATYDLVHASDPGFVIPDLSKYHGVGWSGSSLSVHKQDDERIVQLTDLITQCFARGIPQFGSCFGLQLAVTAAGGKVQKNPRGKELGVARKIRLTNSGRAHPMYEGKPMVFDAFSSHNDEVTHLPMAGATLLATNGFTTVQSACVRYLNGEFWGVQYHPEYDMHEMARLMYCRRQVNTNLGFFRSIEDADRHLEDYEALHADHQRKDLAWKLGLDEDVLDTDVRTCEVKNFIKHLVLPYKKLVESE